VTQKARKKAKAKARKKAKKRRIAEKEEKKKILEYLQQLWDKVLAENATFLEGTEEPHIAGSKCKEITQETIGTTGLPKKIKENN